MSISIIVGLAHSKIDVRSAFFCVPEQVAIVRDRLAPANQVHVATICAMVWEVSGLPMFIARLTFIMELTDGRFAKVVESCPYHIADDIWAVNGVFPVSKSIARKALGLP